MKIKNLYLYSLTALAVTATQAAQANQPVYAPELDGGVTASIGTFYAVPSSNTPDLPYKTSQAPNEPNQNLSVDNDYDFGIEASLGYIFDNTANGIELSYRGFNTNDSNSVIGGPFYIPDRNEDRIPFASLESKVSYEQNALDLMVSQYMDLGNHVQMRFSAGLAFLELEEEQEFNGMVITDTQQVPAGAKIENEFRGLGPRIGVDARYDFGQGIGIVAGGSFAYYLGELETKFNESTMNGPASYKFEEENHAVTNFRGNVGVDYVYFFNNNSKSTVGLELGYMVDYYDDVVADLTSDIDPARDSVSYSADANRAVSFAGPYLQLKGTF